MHKVLTAASIMLGTALLTMAIVAIIGEGIPSNRTLAIIGSLVAGQFLVTCGMRAIAR